MSVVIAVDQSTSATKALLFDHQGNVLERVSIEHTQFYPQPGFVEHDALEIISNVYRAIQSIIEQASITPADVQYLSLANQRETVVVWDRHTSKPVTRAIVWQDQRGIPYTKRLQATQAEEIIRERTGLIVDTYFSAPKIQWVLDHGVDGAAAKRGDLLWGTIDSWMVWNLTAGRVHATDYSNACRTMLFNIDTCRWDEDLLRIFNIPAAMCPQARPSDAFFGDAIIPNISKTIPIRGVMGDSHAALFGQCCFKPGMAKVTYGTGSSIMINAGTSTITPPAGIMRSIGWGCNQQVVYALEGNIHATGDTIRWLRDNIALVTDYANAEQLAQSVPNSGGVYLVPAFNGLGAPHWKHNIPALITGITRTTERAHIVRAAIESIAYQVHDVVGAIVPQLHISELRVDGGPTRNEFLMQLQSDILNTPIRISHIEELSALGVMYMGGIALGIWENLESISGLWAEKRQYRPSMEAATQSKLLRGWHSALNQAIAWDTQRE